MGLGIEYWDPKCGLPRTVSADNQSVALGGCGSVPQLSSIPELQSLRDRVATHAVEDDICSDVVAVEARRIVLRSDGRWGGRLLTPAVILGSFACGLKSRELDPGGARGREVSTSPT